MRILISSSPGVGHLLPLLPVARAARDRGHEVRIAAGDSLAPIIAAAGFAHEPAGPATLGQVAAEIPGLAGLTGRRRALVMLREAFCGPVASGIADDVMALTDRWRPDLILHEDRELGSWVVAERLAIPHATIQATAWRPRMGDVAGQPLNALRAQHGLQPDPGLAGVYGSIFFTTRPPSLRDPAMPLPQITAELRPIADDRHAGSDSATADPFPEGRGSGRLRVAVTLGTVNADQRDVLLALVAGAAATAGHVVVAGADPATLGALPENVTVRAYVPMSTLLPAADLVAFHGGSGTMLAALGAACPMLIVPLAADQPDNADLCTAAGVARALPAEDLTAMAVREAIEAILADPSYARRAGEIAAEVAVMPGPDAAVERLEALVASG